MLNQGEDIWQTAEREVLEETGIKAKFISIIGWRQTHNVPFGNVGKSDLFFLVLLKALTNNITMQESEIEDCKWMPVIDLLKLPQYTPGTVFYEFNLIAINSVRQYFINQSLPDSDKKDLGFLAQSVPLGLTRPMLQTLFYTPQLRKTPESNIHSKL